MLSSIGRSALKASAVAIVLLAGTAFAQPAQTPPATADAAAPHHHHHDPGAMRAHRAQHLRDALQLQPGQQAALDAFLDSMKPPGGEHRMHDRGQPGGQPGGQPEHLTTPQRLDKMVAHFDEMRARVTARAEATKRFYAQLTPDQQKAFDALGPMLGHHGGHGGGHDGMRGGGQGDGHWGHHHGDMDGGHEMGPDGQPHG